MPQHSRPPRRRRILGAVPRLVRAVGRRRRESLQFSAVLIAILLSLLAFVVAGNFLSAQIARSLFNERRDQALQEASSGFDDVQQIFDNAVATDQSEVQKVVRETLTILETHGADAKRQWILVPLDYQAGQAYVGPQSQSSSLTSASVPEDLQKEVAAQDGVYWESSSLPGQNGRARTPVLIVGSKVRLNQGNQFALYLVYDLSSSQQTVDYIQFVIVLGFAILLVFVGTIVWWVTRSVIRPITLTARTAQRLAGGDLDERVIVRGENELAVLGTSFNEMAEGLQRQIVQLETLSTMQQQFVSDVSHELRTPLTTVKMAAEMLYQGRDRMDGSLVRSSELLYHQVDRFDAMLADLLEISRFDAGSATVVASTVDLGDFVEDALEDVRPHLDRRGLEIRVHGTEQRCTVEMDPRRIERVLRNLLVNAIEHSEGRPIDVYTAFDETSVAVAVRDHGIGMTPEESQLVFNRFWRADPSRKRTLGGTGLGLSIATEDVALHHGRLEAWGEPGKGACFRMTLPRTQDHEAGRSPLGLPPDGVPDTPPTLPRVALPDGAAAETAATPDVESADGGPGVPSPEHGDLQDQGPQDGNLQDQGPQDEDPRDEERGQQ